MELCFPTFCSYIGTKFWCFILNFVGFLSFWHGYAPYSLWEVPVLTLMLKNNENFMFYAFSIAVQTNQLRCSSVLFQMVKAEF